MAVEPTPRAVGLYGCRPLCAQFPTGGPPVGPDKARPSLLLDCEQVLTRLGPPPLPPQFRSRPRSPVAAWGWA